MGDLDTLDESWTYRRGGQQAGDATPGLLILFSGSTPQLLPIPLDAGTHVLGREGVGGVFVKDRRMSRRHAEVSFEEGRWRVRDLGSHNGTFLDGQRLEGARVTAEHRVLRIGDTLFGLMSDLGPFRGQAVERRNEVVVGPTLKRRWAEVERAAASARTLHIVGESGTGKELAARRFHSSGPRASGPFIAVNCATLPANLAERLLFGTKKGAYSGADAAAEGYLQAADGGTLFLDEIGELELPVQAKLLRAIETREVLPLGASRPTEVDLVVCSATHRDLRARAGEGAFRSDLWFRIATPMVRLPPVRERLEEIPWLVQSAIEGRLSAHVSLVEACLLREWPGNVRELQKEIRGAAAAATAAGRKRIEVGDLSPLAGRPLRPAAPPPESDGVDDEAILEALRKEKGNVAGAARRIGMHRTQLRRWVTRNQARVRAVIDEE